MTMEKLSARLGDEKALTVVIDARKHGEYAVSHPPGDVWAETP